jgi:iron complex outermembrane receptor protein
MKKQFYASTAALAVVMATGLAAPALAQEGAGADDNGTIIVTARRVEERLQDVPISITVFNQDQITKRNIITATDLGTYTPSLSVNQRYGPEKASFAIRGFVQEQGTAPSVGVYFADVVAPRAQGGTVSGNTAVAGSFMDLQNVQVLKGPQGTLFGRNTTGGAVLLVPQKPTGKFEGSIEGSLGDYDMRRIQGVINVPVMDTLKVRLAVDRNTRDGYMHNLSGIGPDNYNNLDYFALRFSAVADLTPNLENYLIATYSNSFSRGYAARIVACDPTATTGARGLTATSACDQLARQTARGDGPMDVEVDNHNPYTKLRHWQLINTTTWRASDELTIKNIASYQEFRERSSFSLNSDNFTVSNVGGSGGFNLGSISPALNGVIAPAGTKYQYILLNPDLNGNNSTQSTFSEELQFQGNALDGRLIWQAGGYLEISRPLDFSAGRTGILANCVDPETLNCTNPLFIGSISQSETKANFDNKGIYAQGTFKFTDQLSMTAGIRYTWDKTEVLAESTRLTLPNTVRCNDPVRFPSGIPGLGMIVTNASQCALTFAAKSDKPTWLVDLDYKPIDDLMLYAKYARGYRAGGANPTNIGFETWQPEKVDTYEIGAKFSFNSFARGYFNVAGFYNDFSNQQIVANAISNTAGFAGAQAVINAGASRIDGVEVDTSALFFNSLRIDVGYTYLDTKLKSINLPPIPAGAPYSALLPTAVVGGPLALSPKNRVTVTGSYTLPFSDSIGKVSVGATFVHTDSQLFGQATLPQYQHLPPSDILNVNVDWNNVMGKPVDLAFFMTNVTNELVPVAVGFAYQSAGFENQLYAPPRMFGFRLRYRFGQ